GTARDEDSAGGVPARPAAGRTQGETQPRGGSRGGEVDLGGSGGGGVGRRKASGQIYWVVTASRGRPRSRGQVPPCFLGRHRRPLARDRPELCDGIQTTIVPLVGDSRSRSHSDSRVDLGRTEARQSARTGPRLRVPGVPALWISSRWVGGRRIMPGVRK